MRGAEPLKRPFARLRLRPRRNRSTSWPSAPRVSWEPVGEERRRGSRPRCPLCLFLMAMPTLSGIMGAGCSRGSQAVTVRISGFAAHKSSKSPRVACRRFAWPSI